MLLVLCVFLAQIYVFMCFLPCFMLSSTFLHAYMFRSTCLGFYAMYSYVLCLFLFQVDVWVTCSHAYIMLLAMPCLDLCAYVFISMLYGQILVFTCLYARIHVLPCLYAKFLCLHACLYAYAYIYASTCLCVWIYALYMFHVIFHVLVRSMPCSRAQTQAMFVMPCAIVALLSLYLSFLCFGLLVRTRYRLCGLGHCPYTKAHVKGFGSSYLHVYACLLLCFMLVLASLVVDFATLDTLSGFVVVWLHSTPMRPCLDATTWDALP